MMRRPIHRAIRMAVDVGLPRKWQQDFLPQELVLPQTSAERNNRPSTLDPMTFEQTIASASFYLSAITVSLCIFVWEIRALIFDIVGDFKKAVQSMMHGIY